MFIGKNFLPNTIKKLKFKLINSHFSITLKKDRTGKDNDNIYVVSSIMPISASLASGISGTNALFNHTHRRTYLGN